MNLNTHTNLEIALAICGGFADFGNGEERKARLGDRYGDIQAKINNILDKGIIPDSDCYERFMRDGEVLARYYMTGKE